MTGISRCLAKDGAITLEMTKSPDFWSILQRLHQHPEAAPIAFDSLQDIVQTTPPVITADNYEAAVDLANEFATAGGLAISNESRKEAPARRQKPVKQPKAQ